jgi:hypothetical protein
MKLEFVMAVTVKSNILWNGIPCSLLVIYSATFLSYSSTLKMEKIHSFESLANFYQTSQDYIPEDFTLPKFLFRSLCLTLNV